VSGSTVGSGSDGVQDVQDARIDSRSYGAGDNVSVSGLGMRVLPLFFVTAFARGLRSATVTFSLYSGLTGAEAMRADTREGIGVGFVIFLRLAGGSCDFAVRIVERGRPSSSMRALLRLMFSSRRCS